MNKLILLLFVLIVAAGCGADGDVIGVESSGVVGPQEIANATQVIKFDPATIPTDGAPTPGECVASAIVPGAYRCDMGEGDPAEPCFALGGTRLVCDPDPVGGAAGLLVEPTNTLPSVLPASPDQAVSFFLELAGGLTCAIRNSPEPVIIDGTAAQYDCDQPYTYVMDINKARPTWEAAVHTLNPETGETSGSMPMDVVRVWIP